MCADPVYDWKQPINFYGWVVDESNQPVADANVDYTWSTVGAERGTETKHSATDNLGQFSIHERGKRISITVSKDGYYTTPSERLRSYEYANPGDGLFSPDEGNPVVFHLRKKGLGVELVTSEHGISPQLPIRIPRDGTMIRVDLMQGKIGDAGQILFSEHKPEYKEWQQAKEWSFKMEIPDGGFVGENDEFPFEAPESGYEPVVEFNFNKEQNWAIGVKTNFYIRFGSPPLYGRLQVETDITYGGAILTFGINPAGSRNLEPK